MTTPISVRKTGKGGYKRVTGSRRYQACHVIETNIHPLSLPPGAASIGPDEKVTIDCVVLPSSISKEDASVDALVDNIERIDLTPLEGSKGAYGLVR